MSITEIDMPDSAKTINILDKHISIMEKEKKM